MQMTGTPWLRKYAPPGALGMDFYTYLPVLAKGHVDQQIFWYTAFTSDMVKPGPRGLDAHRHQLTGRVRPQAESQKRRFLIWLNKSGSPKAKVNEKPKAYLTRKTDEFGFLRIHQLSC
jgi:hypothetical protein